MSLELKGLAGRLLQVTDWQVSQITLYGVIWYAEAGGGEEKGGVREIAQTGDAEPMLVYCWASVADRGPALNQQCCTVMWWSSIVLSLGQH